MTPHRRAGQAAFLRTPPVVRFFRGRRTAAAAVAAPLAALLLLGCQPREAAVGSPGGASAPAATPAASGASAAAALPAASAPPLTTSSGLPDFTALVQRVGPAVVNVTTARMARQVPAQMAPGGPLADFFRRFGMAPPPGAVPEPPSGGIGSGFVIDAQGHILTNAHVVAGADRVTVRLADSTRELSARVVGIDRQTDVALLKTEATGLPVAPLGDSSALRAGEWVAAIGSPFGLANTITAGIVSATERALPEEAYVPFIQTDVAVNPGNSGGPLINMRGEVVGINSMIYSQTGGYMGLSFAIPIGLAREIAEQLRTEGRVTRGRLGVGIQELSPALAKSFGLPEPKGALVTRVEPGGPAARAGIGAGDVIQRFAQQEVVDAGALPRLVARARPGTQAAVEVWRNGQRQTVQVTMGGDTAPAAAAAASTPALASAGAGGGAAQLGIVVSELPPPLRRQLGVPYGLLVQAVPAGGGELPGATSLQPGDVIVAVNRQRFGSLEEFTRLVAQAGSGGAVALLVQRDDATLFVPVPVQPQAADAASAPASR